MVNLYLLLFELYLYQPIGVTESRLTAQRRLPTIDLAEDMVVQT